MRLSPSDEEKGSRVLTSKRLFIAGVAVLILPVAGLAAKRLFDRYFPSHSQERFAKLDLPGLPRLPKLPDPPPQVSAPAQVPAAAAPQQLPSPVPAQRESVENPRREPDKAPVQAAKPFKKPRFRQMIGLSEMNLGSRADFGTTLTKQPAVTPVVPKGELPPAPEPTRAVQVQPPQAAAKPAAPPPKAKPAPVYSAPISPAQLKPAPAAPTGEAVAVQPMTSASPTPVDPGPSIVVGAPDKPPPPNPERPMTRGGPCPHPGWWKNTYSDMCYSTIESCRGSANGNGDCIQAAAPVGPCAIPGRCKPKSGF